MYMKRRNFISKPLLRSLVRVSSESSTLMPRRFSTLLDDDQGKDGKNSPRRFSTLLEDMMIKEAKMEKIPLVDSVLFIRHVIMIIMIHF
jgi:hypothetical protein